MNATINCTKQHLLSMCAAAIAVLYCPCVSAALGARLPVDCYGRAVRRLNGAVGGRTAVRRLDQVDQVGRRLPARRVDEGGPQLLSSPARRQRQHEEAILLRRATDAAVLSHPQMWYVDNGRGRSHEALTRYYTALSD